MLGVERSRLMLAVEHPDDDSEEYLDDRHSPSVAELQEVAGQAVRGSSGKGGKWKQVRNARSPHTCDNHSATRKPHLMARKACVAAARVPRHVTQRGNTRQDVFLTDDDRRYYLTVLRDRSRQAGPSF
jgi:hypothetical protein